MSQIKFVDDVALQQNIDETKQYIKDHSTNSVSTMPTASSSLVDKIYQYVGTTTSTYTKGHFYECINDSGTYKWQEIPMGSVEVDDTLSSTSTNPVQNKVIKTALDAKLSSNSDVSNTVETSITASSASYPEIAAGETLKVIFGKIKKYLSDLKGKFDTLKSKGSATKGVYFDANGNIQEMTYTVAKNVPSDAVFTDTTYNVVSKTANGLAPKLPNETTTTKYLRQDGTWVAPPNTKNTAGSTDSSSKLFLIGATSQAANPQTYSQDTAYVGTDGNLYSGSKVVATQSMIGDAWVLGHAYAVGDYCIDANGLYKNGTAHTSTATNRPSVNQSGYWTLVSVADELSEKGTATLLLDKTYTASLRSGYNNSSFGGSSSETLNDYYTNYTYLLAYLYDSTGRLRNSQIIRVSDVIASASITSINLQYVLVNADTKAVRMQWAGYYFYETKKAAIYVEEDSTQAITSNNFRTKLYGIK